MDNQIRPAFNFQRLAWAFMSHPGDGNWNSDADLNCDQVVNIFDLQILVWHFTNYIPEPSDVMLFGPEAAYKKHST